ncbi:BREX-1 system adenine-specific DNA-methyltransferase PglX [Lacihabitans soyangensis]|uniref:site-specific DNA-methyltransferase (adenine-specific) n=1 Tax=Lacihabitans soyangensis TaxID=869394 RepID=A0AAE3KW50_9BACT|nr:BREX-1 system adenine-specific DNA-methyltransferase PglX [Lacihabitans soyangensis]MCP9762295.1 BREX-1 system adenine-specific DNA-methyltransferase PglX [Lacihabitans soyangensis]
MKLSDHVEHIRQLIDTAFRNRLGRMGFANHELSQATREAGLNKEQERLNNILETFQLETGNKPDAFEKLVEELTFTLFNRLAALKVMEAHALHPEIITKNSLHGNRSFAHKMWLEANPDHRNEELEALGSFIEVELGKLAKEIPLFSLQHPYHLLPTTFELSGIINAFNQVETDAQVEDHIWKSDDVLGWLYESYNVFKKKQHDLSGLKTEYNKVSIQSQYYTPRWVVQFLVDNSLGKLYLEMYPNSDIRHKYKIANAPNHKIRERKPLHEIRMIDPSTGSGNYLLYGFDMYYDLYIDQIENYGADYNEADVPKLIIEHNLHGVDLDDRAIQLAQLGLYIKAKRKKRTVKIEHFNIVSSDFYLPAYSEVNHIFESEGIVKERERKIIEEVWEDLQQAHKFGSLIRLEEKLHWKFFGKNDGIVTLFDQQELEDFDTFREHFFTNLQKAVAQNAEKQGETFLNTKTHDAITFLELMTQKYDVAVANPPYTDSADFGPELKKFVDANYKKPYKFNTNLYAVFINRCFELTTENGKIALIHPLTFMYIKTFEDVRKFILGKTHISVFVDYSADSTNLFDGAFASAPAFYVLEKGNEKQEKSWFISLDQYTRTPNEKLKKDFCLEALDDIISNRPNKHNIKLFQEKLKTIEGSPFIYWISDGFREKFKEKAIDDILKPRQGIATGNNDKCVKYWWEIEQAEISKDLNDMKKWKFYSKGGAYNKWYGNFWTVIDYSPSGYNFLLNSGNHLPSRNYYFLEGVTYSALGKGVSFRYMPPNQLFDVGGSCIFPGEFKNVKYYLSFLNTKLTFYLANCLNPTVNTQVGDLKRIPFVIPSKKIENTISQFATYNIDVKHIFCSYRITETNYKQSLLIAFQGASLKERILAYLTYENALHTQVLINEAIINEIIFEVYELSDADRGQVEAKMGLSIGSLAVFKEAKDAFLGQLQNPMAEVTKHIQNLPIATFDEQQISEIRDAFGTLYQSNNDLEEFCIRHQVNPINVWYWFKESRVLPQARVAEIALEFLADAFRTILMEDVDGIVPLVSLPGEPRLYDRFEKYCYDQGFTDAQIMQLDGLLGRPLNDYIEQHFFKNLSDHLNLFMYLPKTPFIWHLSSGEQQGFEAFIIIYKWTSDSLYKLKSTYLSQRTERLNNRKAEIADTNTGQAQTERETIEKQLREIEIFEQKIDDLIASGYNPKLDDGVGKNIAPLQARGMLKAEVLKTTGGAKSQLNKYLNADW